MHTTLLRMREWIRENLIIPTTISLLSRASSADLKIGSSPWPVWLSWLEHRPVDQRLAGLIPGQGTPRRQPMDVSPSLPSFLSKSNALR